MRVEIANAAQALEKLDRRSRRVVAPTRCGKAGDPRANPVLIDVSIVATKNQKNDAAPSIQLATS